MRRFTVRGASFAFSMALGFVLAPLGPQALAQGTLTDDFERADGPADGWTTAAGTWAIASGKLTTTSAGVEAWVWAGDPPVKADVGDLEIHLTMGFGAKPADAVGQHGGIMFCASNPTGRYALGTVGYTIDWIDRAEDHGFRLIRVDNTATAALHTILVASTPEVTDIPSDWLIQLEGDVIRLIADGNLIFEVTDGTYRGGHLGFWVYSNGTQMQLDAMEFTYPVVELGACFTANTLLGVTPLSVDFDASCTQSVHGVDTYAWDFADGSTGSGVTVNHIFGFGGTYMVTLTVTDMNGTVRTATATVEVLESTGSFSDDFERPDGPVDGWTVHQGDWNISEGRLLTSTSGLENWAWAGDPPFVFPANFTMTFDLEFLSTPLDAVGRHGGIMFCATRATQRWDTAMDGYSVDWIDRVTDRGIRLIRSDNGVQTVLDVAGGEVTDPPLHWEVVVEGEAIRIYGDGTEILSATDSTYRQGVFGVWAYANQQSLALDNIDVSSPSLSPCFMVLPDAVPPLGTEVTFDASCSSSTGTPIIAYRWDFGDGSTGTGAQATHTYTTTGPMTAKLTVETEGASTSATERIVEVFEPVTSYTDDFERADGPVDGWTVQAGTWALLDGTLRATVADFPEAWIWAGYPALRVMGDTSIEFRLDFPAGAPADPAAVGRHAGVLFYGRTTNPRGMGNSGYIFDWIDQARAYRMSIWTNGTERNLATVTGDTEPGTLWRVEVEGDTIRLLVDGALKIEVLDATYRKGHVGFWAYPGVPATAYVQEAAFDDVTIGEGGIPEVGFRRGDSNADGLLNITDGIFVLNYLFLGGPTPTCTEAANANDDPVLNITDGIFILNFLFLGGPNPPSPGPDSCGPDPVGSPTDLGCEAYDPAKC